MVHYQSCSLLNKLTDMYWSSCCRKQLFNCTIKIMLLPTISFIALSLLGNQFCFNIFLAFLITCLLSTSCLINVITGFIAIYIFVFVFFFSRVSAIVICSVNYFIANLKTNHSKFIFRNWFSMNFLVGLEITLTILPFQKYRILDLSF